mmetsp:Transcript_2042/g.4924  ORF Transcript_2042/g.4924 Transcript_2042/m.4924 type:complete len:218 (+) Transcript_2042:365-1018(+)
MVKEALAFRCLPTLDVGEQPVVDRGVPTQQHFAVLFLLQKMQRGDVAYLFCLREAQALQHKAVELFQLFQDSAERFEVPLHAVVLRGQALAPHVRVRCFGVQRGIQCAQSQRTSARYIKQIRQPLVARGAFKSKDSLQLFQFALACCTVRAVQCAMRRNELLNNVCRSEAPKYGVQSCHVGDNLCTPTLPSSLTVNYSRHRSVGDLNVRNRRCKGSQ